MRQQRNNAVWGKRLLSAILSVAMIVTLTPLTGMLPDSEAYGATGAYAATATQEQLRQTADTFTSTDGGGMLKIIDGKLWVWGSNSGYGLGLAKDANGNDTSHATVVEKPVLHDFAFDGNIKKVIASYASSVYVYTDTNKVYGWGSSMNQYVTSAYSKDSSKTPVLYDMSEVKGNIIEMESSTLAVSIKTDFNGGTWYIAGCLTANYSVWNMVDRTELTPIKFREPSAEFLQKLGNDSSGQPRTIAKILPTYGGGSCFVITNDNRLFSLGNNNHNQNFLPDKLNEEGIATAYGASTEPVDVFADPQNAEIAPYLEGVDLTKNLATNGVNSTIIDKDGSVWAVGTNNDNSVGPSSWATPLANGGRLSVSRPHKVIDAKTLGKTVIKSFITNSVITYLCDDNTLYAVGRNSNGFISATAGATVDTPMQIFQSISQKETITGVYPSEKGTMVMTRNGNMYYSGDNSGGTAGTGDTESGTPGSVDEVVQPTLPPTAPLTDNKISFEIEMKDGTKYRANPENEDEILKTDTNGHEAPLVGDFKIMAGQPFKFNIYFEDFGKLHSFVIPLRFDPSVVKVVNGNGEAYPDKTVTPGKIGDAVGIVQCFNDQTWTGGILAGAEGKDGTYPKIDNRGGWVSVLGYTSNYNAKITGKQKMVSISFMATGTTTSFKSFDFATASNGPVVEGETYDRGGVPEFDYGAGWFVNNSATVDLVTAFEFQPEPFPAFKTEVIPLKNFSLIMKRNTANGEGEDVKTVDDGKGIDYKNSDATYTITVDPNPANASFPQVDWTLDLVSPDDGATVYQDYVSVVEQRDTSITFKVPDNFTKLDTIGKVKFTATSRTYGTTQTMNVYVKSFDPPSSVKIKEKYVSGTAIEDMTYHYHPTSGDAAGENKTFTAELTFDSEGAKENKEVNWKLMKKDGTELDLNSPDCPILIDAIDAEAGTIAITPQKTTFGDDYVILRVESLYDTGKYDELKLKVQFYPAAIKFKQEIIRMPINTVKNLADYLDIAPQDVYQSNLKWTFETQGAYDDGPYIAFNTDGQVTALDKATPSDPTEIYEVVKVTDQLTGLSAQVKISVLELDSPVNPDDVTVKNLLGSDGDWVEIAQGLLPGDVLHFYKSYEDADPYITTTPLLDYQAAANAKFSVPGLLDSAGGEISIQVEREKGDPAVMTPLDRVPVSYSAEPSKVYGYVRLAGKDIGSARNTGIRVDLMGTSHEETVYTGENGYFEFTEYIPPGNYWLTLSQDKYLKRVIKPNEATGYQGIVIPAKDEFYISTYDDPIYLYPGDLNADGAVNNKDITTYVKTWVGQYSTAIPDFDKYDFYDSGYDAVINPYDLNMLLMRNGWVRDSYPKWSTPAQ